MLPNRPAPRAAFVRGGALTCTLWLAAGSSRAAPPTTTEEPRIASDPAAVDRRIDLTPTRGGELRYRGPNFTAFVRPDGSVSFRDLRGGTTLYLGVRALVRGEPQPRTIFQPVQARDEFEVRAINPVVRDTRNFEYATSRGALLLIPVRIAQFGGLSDWTLPQRHVVAKQAFLAATAGLRMRMAFAWQRVQIERRLDELGEDLVAIWRDPRRSLAERKRRLFELWDECEEPAARSPSPLDALRTAAAVRARLRIELFIRRVAPPGTPEAYNRTELAGFNRVRRSTYRFDPYAAADVELPEWPRDELPVEPTEALPVSAEDSPPAMPAVGPSPPPQWPAPAE